MKPGSMKGPVSVNWRIVRSLQ